MTTGWNTVLVHASDPYKASRPQTKLLTRDIVWYNTHNIYYNVNVDVNLFKNL